MNIKEILDDINSKLESASERIYLASVNPKSNGLVVLSDVKEELRKIVSKIDDLEDLAYGRGLL